MPIEPGDEVTFHYTGRLEDGTLFDTTREADAEASGQQIAKGDEEFGPVTVEAGTGQLIAGLDEALLSMEVGDRDSFTFPPEKAYGEHTDEYVVEEPYRRIAKGMENGEPEVGAYIQTLDRGIGEILAMDDDTITIDFNHQLAGKTLEFDVEVVDAN